MYPCYAVGKRAQSTEKRTSSRTMALTVALGLGISGVAAAGCYGLYRLLFRSVDAATDREERRETQSSIADASSSGDEVASVSENDSGEEILKDVEESNSEGNYITESVSMLL